MSFLLKGKQTESENIRFEKRERAGCKSMNKLFESRIIWIDIRCIIKNILSKLKRK